MRYLCPLQYRCCGQQQQHAAAAAAPRTKNKNEHVRSDPPTHHDIVKQYSKGLTAVADRCVYISYNRYHSVPKSCNCCCSGRDSCMLTSRCMLPWLRSAPYPALRPCEPCAPCARSATCKPCPMALVPDSTVHCSRPPARNLDLSSSDHAQGPWVAFIYIQLSKLFKNGPGMPLNTRCRAWLDQLQTSYRKTSTRRLR